MISEHESGMRRRIRGIVILPNAFTLGNLFFGFWGIVAAVRGDFGLAAWMVFIAAVADGLDGRIARFANTHSEFGVELDSLVDLVSFGVAPAVIAYRLFLESGEWGWTLSFLYLAAVGLRLARFNIEQGGRAKRHFHGLPSPIAGVTVASFYPFSQTPFFQQFLSPWPWPTLVGGGMIVLSGLMLSHVLYPTFPRISLRDTRGRTGLAVILTAAVLLIWRPHLFIFTAGIAYVVYGAAKAVIIGLLERLPDRDPLSEEFELREKETETRDLEYEEMGPDWRGHSAMLPGNASEGEEGD